MVQILLKNPFLHPLAFYAPSNWISSISCEIERSNLKLSNNFGGLARLTVPLQKANRWTNIRLSPYAMHFRLGFRGRRPRASRSDWCLSVDPSWKCAGNCSRVFWVLILSQTGSQKTYEQIPAAKLIGILGTKIALRAHYEIYCHDDPKGHFLTFRQTALFEPQRVEIDWLFWPLGDIKKINKHAQQVETSLQWEGETL